MHKPLGFSCSLAVYCFFTSFAHVSLSVIVRLKMSLRSEE